MDVKDELIKNITEKSNLEIIQDLDNQNFYDRKLNNGLCEKAKI